MFIYVCEWLIIQMVYRYDLYVYIYDFQGHVYGWDIFYGLIWFLAPPNLVCDSMSIIGIWELRAMRSWREPPPESIIPWYWLELGAACYAFVLEPPPEFLSLYVWPSEAHHSSHMPLGRVYGVYDIWGQLLVCHFYGFSRLVYG